MSFNMNAQKCDFSISPMLGVSTPLLDGGTGVEVSVNPHLTINRFIAIEGQVSYTYTSISGAFLSGNTGKSHAAQTLIGGRFYFNSKEKKVRPYANLLLGGLYYNEEMNDNTSSSEFSMGYSTGFFVDIHQFLIGISFEAPGALLFKVGYDIPIKKTK